MINCIVAIKWHHFVGCVQRIYFQWLRTCVHCRQSFSLYLSLFLSVVYSVFVPLKTTDPTLEATLYLNRFYNNAKQIYFYFIGSKFCNCLCEQWPMSKIFATKIYVANQMCVVVHCIIIYYETRIVYSDAWSIKHGIVVIGHWSIRPHTLFITITLGIRLHWTLRII